MTFVASASGDTAITRTAPSAVFSGPFYSIAENSIVHTLGGYVKTPVYQATWGNDYPRHQPTPAQLLTNYNFSADDDVYHEDYQWAWKELKTAIEVFTRICESAENLSDLGTLRERSEAWVQALPRRADESRSAIHHGNVSQGRGQKTNSESSDCSAGGTGERGSIGLPGSTFVLGQRRDTMGIIEDVEEED